MAGPDRNRLPAMASPSSRSAALPVSMALFTLGLIAIVSIFALYATGHENLPLWLNLATLLTPLGLIIGVVSTIASSRRS